jgi:hypothetical protein
MSNYPEITEGLGKLTPALWKRLMKGLKDVETFSQNNAMRVRDRKGRGGKRTAGASNLVKVKNTGANTILKYEACVVQDNVITLTDKLDACEDCSGGTICDFGDCGVWPGGGEEGKGYADIYDLLRGSPAFIIEVKDARSTSTTKPKPGALMDVLVAAGDIAAGEEGFCYESGLHWAWLWDPRGLTNAGGLTSSNGTFYRHQMLYADLPDTPVPYEVDEESFRQNYDDPYQQYIAKAQICRQDPDPYGVDQSWYAGSVTAYNPGFTNSLSDEPNGVDGYEVWLPLVARPQGRYRIHWVDLTYNVYQNESDGPAGSQVPWPVSEWINNGGDEDVQPVQQSEATQQYPKIRMALVERLPHWYTPTVTVQVTSYERWDNFAALGSCPYLNCTENDVLRYAYAWRLLLTGTDYSSGSARFLDFWRLGIYGRGKNLAEWHNCRCTDTTEPDNLCGNCLNPLVPDSNDYAGGVHIEKLNECFGLYQWDLMPISGLSCDSAGAGKQSFINMTMGIDELGNQQPSFQVQNAVQSGC